MTRSPSKVTLINPAQRTPHSKIHGHDSSDDKLTLNQLCAELQVARSTFYDWRAKGHAPRCIKLPNGDLRIRRSDLEIWLAEHEETEVG